MLSAASAVVTRAGTPSLTACVCGHMMRSYSHVRYGQSVARPVAVRSTRRSTWPSAHPLAPVLQVADLAHPYALIRVKLKR